MRLSWMVPGGLWIALVACTAGDTGTDRITEAELEALEAEILAQIGDASCASGEDCRTVEFGSKPCGGPVSILAYCASTVDEAALLADVEAYNELQAAYNAQEQLSSTCAELGDPGPAWVDGVCVLAESRGARWPSSARPAR